MERKDSDTRQAADRELVQRLRAGDRQAWQQVSRDLVRFAEDAGVRGRAGWSGDPEDFAAMVRLRLVEGALEKFRFECRFSSYLRLMVRRAIQDAVRSPGGAREEFDERFHSLDPDGEEPGAALDAVSRDEVVRAVQDCLGRLSTVRGQTGALAGTLGRLVLEETVDRWMETADLLLEVVAQAFPDKSGGAQRVIKCRFLHDLRDCLRPRGVFGGGVCATAGAG